MIRSTGNQQSFPTHTEQNRTEQKLDTWILLLQWKPADMWVCKYVGIDGQVFGGDLIHLKNPPETNHLPHPPKKKRKLIVILFYLPRWRFFWIHGSARWVACGPLHFHPGVDPFRPPRRPAPAVSKKGKIKIENWKMIESCSIHKRNFNRNFSVIQNENKNISK